MSGLFCRLLSPQTTCMESFGPMAIAGSSQTPGVLEISSAFDQGCPQSADRAKKMSGLSSPEVVSRQTTSIAPLLSTAAFGAVETPGVAETFVGGDQVDPQSLLF